MLNFISKIFKPTVVENAVLREQEEITQEQILSERPKQRKVTFRVDSFMQRNIEGLIANTNLSISIIVKSALYDYVTSYKILGSEPYEIGHWLDDSQNNVSAGRYTITLDDTLANELERLEAVYRAKGLRFNKSHFIRCAVIDRVINLILDDS